MGKIFPLQLYEFGMNQQSIPWFIWCTLSQNIFLTRTNWSYWGISRNCLKRSYFWHTVCPRSSDSFFVVTYYIKWVTISWTDGSQKFSYSSHSDWIRWFPPVSEVKKAIIYHDIMCGQEVVTQIYSNLLYKMGNYFLDRR